MSKLITDYEELKDQIRYHDHRYYSLDEVAEYWLQVLKINDFQKKRFSENVIDELGNNLNNKIISILGWAFKKDTNDSRE